MFLLLLTCVFIAMFTCIMNDNLKVEKSKISGKRAHISQVRDNNVAIGVTSRTPEGLRRIRGTHGSFAYASEWIGGRQSYNSLAVPLNYNGKNLKSILLFQLHFTIINVIYMLYIIKQ